ncbi:MAG: DinB family protein [Pseudomonadota bacterium]
MTPAITADWMRMMARYNAWQNAWFLDVCETLDPAELTRDRGAFFESILGTLSHLLWGDALWMSRFDGGAAPEGGIATSPRLFPDWPTFAPARRTMDARILDWTATLDDNACAGDLSWFSGAMGRDVTKSRSLVFTHFFNHQTHHRGQVHGMLTATGVTTSDTDLFFLPDDPSKETP